MTSSDYTEPAVALGQHRMPLLGFGTWQIENDDAPQATTTALELGYRHIDTATGYGNEAGIGAALASSGLDRDAVFVTTKLPPENVGHERQTIEESLTKLGLDRVDLWLVHWPPNSQASPEVWEHVIKAQQDGLATSIGVSNYSLAQIDELVAATGVTPAVNQIRWSPGIYDAAVAEGLAERGVVLEGYSPFKASNLDDPTLLRIAEAHDATAAQVIVAWHVAHDYVVIPKSVRRERIEANGAGARIELSAEEVAAIDGLGA
ncbi:aldo/keto reductase [Microlunatus antarcticus]|uniref:Diketogulonate reductase-like aldo/keto reductase n=1 Tax=Microlunatus antarcticus TaxID=53388 RepID=A0A7W5JVQ5_9ACTN|nr:aldo/keto reductase [Microlunatus antarcticus]MBB3326642.1 diketogulonate reductase-like aldo/keto reductase [Microlunatus antarcticus]